MHYIFENTFNFLNLTFFRDSAAKHAVHPNNHLLLLDINHRTWFCFKAALNIYHRCFKRNICTAFNGYIRANGNVCGPLCIHKQSRFQR